MGVVGWSLAAIRAGVFLALSVPLSAVFFAMSPVFHLLHMLTDSIMWFFIGKCFIYNISWEDPRIDQRLFRLSESDHVITLCSAGDNALDYILEGAKVTAVDLNPCQIALAELKMVAAQCLPYEEFFAIFALSDTALLRARYFSQLRPKMSSLGQRFWDSYVYRLKNFLYSGSSGFAAWVLFRVIFPLFGLSWIRKAVERGATREEFLREVEMHSRQVKTLCYICDKYIFKGFAAFAGVPKAQLKLGLHRSNNAETIFNIAFLESDLVRDNYFFGGYVLGRWTKECCPRYLKEHNYPKLQKYLQAGNLKLVCSSLDAFLSECADGEFTVASLLDHLDWMNAHQVNREIAHLLPKMDQQRGRLFWRSFSERLHSAPLVWLNPKRVDDTGDRVGMYFSTWIASVADSDYTLVERTQTAHLYQQGLLQNIVTGAKVVSFPFWQAFVKPHLDDSAAINQHQSTMEAFYRFQKEGYDAFRERMLHSRPLLMELIPIRKGGNMVWVDIGGGTARNLEFLPVEVVKKYFKAIYIVDISASLLEIAARRVKACGLDHIVHLVEADCTHPSVWSSLPSPGSVDVVTMSYSLSMIPDKRTAVANAVKLLKPKGKGTLGVGDFFLYNVNDHRLPPHKALLRNAEARFHRWWFANDHVHLLDPPTLRLVTASTETMWDQRFRGPIPFIPLFRPIHGVMLVSTR
ncbi:unnamed protein product [Vitrella brassicaformis CCMP3155]|uniref:Methyltransferase type 12 domain-containing protein n=1 Tax=Vitrella brassicaformis (strain CCMP3155) TaxID=1169540 RepID=A0A0G4GWP6_VITBC|nr:unnamed protein product [Vitrella brassicaformis CCMP3155]|eukprot:CEM35387.1 unnamed protein product [Vitrella brassicaformis CCMP3155]